MHRRASVCASATGRQPGLHQRVVDESLHRLRAEEPGVTALVPLDLGPRRAGIVCCGSQEPCVFDVLHPASTSLDSAGHEIGPRLA